MISNVPGARPNTSIDNRSLCRGFSLIEVLMTVVLLAVSLALAVPSFRDMVEKRQVTNAAEQVASFINTAQGVAMKTNQLVTVSWTHNGDSDWCIGATSGTAACDCSQTDTTAGDYCQIDAMAYVINASHTNNLQLMHAMIGDGAYSFDPVRGLVVDLETPLSAEIRSPSGDYRLNLVMNSVGRVILCSDDSAYAIPGYKVCSDPGDSGGDIGGTEDPPIISDPPIITDPPITTDPPTTDPSTDVEEI